MQWINLQLDMLPAIAIETAKVVELYKNISKEVEGGVTHLAPKLKQLKMQLNKRVAQLDHFYNKFYFDQRIHLFHRLKLQLKKVLTRHVQEIDNSFIHPQSLDVSKVREELALIESTLQKEYEINKKDDKPLITVTNSKKSFADPKIKPDKNFVTSNIPNHRPKQVVNKLNFEKIKATQIKDSKQIGMQSKNRSSANESKRKSVISSQQPSSRPPEVEIKKPSKVPMHQLVFTIKMSKEQYLQFLQAKKGN